MSPAIPFLYSYGVGGILFSIGIWFAWKQGYINRTPSGIRNLLACLGVVAFFAVLQGFLQFAPMSEAEAVPYDGGAEHVIGNEGGSTNSTTDDSATTQDSQSERVSEQRVRGTTLDYAIMAAYFLAILGVGTWFARRQKTIKDFFFGGQRFSWWLIAFSLIATTVGSYSFVKYSNKGFGYGLSSSQTYLNDWIWVPLLVFGWLPILYFSRVTSIPDYLGRRFNSQVRFWSTILVLIYLIGYVGVNLFTMGKVLNALVGWEIPVAAMVVAMISGIYVTAGGQTSVIMTDLLQGVMLLLVGVLILVLGISYMGGFDSFWSHLPRDARLAFPNFNEDSSFPSVGIFWQDAIANTGMFYLINQGIIMRFLATKSLAESRKAAFSMVLILMTVAACVVGGGGWVAQSLSHAGHLPNDLQADDSFYVATEFLAKPGVFGLILAALTAALMSTVDTLITAVSSLVVNDLYRPHVRPEATEKELLRVARLSAIGVTVIGVALVPIFMMFDSIYDAHGAFTAAVTPPLVVTLVLSVFWRRFTAVAALATMIGGLGAIALSVVFPEIIIPFAHGVPMGEAGDGFLAGAKQFKFMRACFGIGVSLCIGIPVAWLTRPEPFEKQRGLVWGTVADALRKYKGSEGSERSVRTAPSKVEKLSADVEFESEAELPAVRISQELAQALDADLGALLYVTDSRAWLGGLRSAHVIVADITNSDEHGDAKIELPKAVYESVIVPRRASLPVRVERLY